MTKFLATLGVVAALLIGGVAYVRIGWEGMVRACENQALADGLMPATYTFTVQDGFTCTWENGETTTSWWFTS